MRRNSQSGALQRGCISGIAALLIVGLLLVPAGVLGVWQGALQPPWFEQRLGDLRVVGFRTWNANCPPFTGCDPSLREAYVVWLVGQRRGEQPADATRLLSLPIAHPE